MSIYRDKPPANRSVLVCSGLDPSGGAGFIADTRVVAALGARPVGVVTALTVQNTLGVSQVSSVDSEIVGAQLASLLGDVEVHAVKLGMLGSVQVAKEISYGLDLTAAPVVWDPVAAPSRGRAIFDGESFEEILAALSRHLRLITPNVIELGLLCGRDIRHPVDAIHGARALIERIGDIDVLVKGGHFDDAEEAMDLLVTKERVEEFKGKRIAGPDVHGTGCVLSSAIATYLANGLDIVDACRSAKDFVAAQIAAAVKPGRGGPAAV
ncbi:MAG: hydroxymethylpyrimidine/phosphomethylpyrimidine kinase [Myxococcota bacterium]|nr:hydroxymethylpyrimidine/phosphomethylpyrimidine kinase [Myxococcota bacterium]